MLAGIKEEVLKVGFDARFDVGEALAGNMLAGGAETREVILRRRDITPEFEVARLEHHLEERDIPANIILFAKPHVVGGDRRETRDLDWGCAIPGRPSSGPASCRRAPCWTR